MKWPWVLRIRLEFAEQQIRERDVRIAELIEANKVAMQAIDAAKDAKAVAEKELEDAATRPHRVLGSEIRRMATQRATERARERGVKK
jgi:hypothetical protein